MKKVMERRVAAAVLIIGIVVIAAIIANAWKLLNAPREPAKENTIAAEAPEDIWIEVVELESNEDMTLSLKEAVLGNAERKKDLIVFTQDLSDIIKVTDKGSLPFNLSAKYQYIKYSGTATYTVDLSGIDEDHLIVDEENKTLTILIPHTVGELSINEDETQADATEKIGIFSLGDLKQSEEERSEVIADVKKNMNKKLSDGNVADIADRMARLSVWEIYQPVVTKVSPEYAVVTEFVDD